MIDIEKLVDLAESLIPEVIASEHKVGMNVTEKLNSIPTDKELLQVSNSVNEILRAKQSNYVAAYWRRTCWDNLERQYHWCVWLTVRKVEDEE